MENIEEKVIEHDFAIKDIAKSIHELSDSSKEANKKLGQIAESMGKQELILEKLANLEVNSKDSINRLHKRIDKTESQAESNRTKIDAVDIRVTSLDANIKANQRRIGSLDNTVVWIARSIIGTLITGLMGLLFFMLRP